MSDNPTQTNRTRFPTFRWVFSWRGVRACLFVLACLFTLLALFYAEENWRGARAEQAYRRELEAKGRNLDWTAFVPPPVPDAQNFAMTPFLAPLFDFNQRPLQPGQTWWRDTNAWQRTMDFAKDFPDLSHKGGWRTGKKVELAAWKKEFEKMHRGKIQGTNSALPEVSAAAQAAGWLREAMREYQPVLDELRAASQRQRSRFNLQYDMENPAEILLPHLAKIKRLCQILEVQALAELELGRIDSAASDFNLMLHLSDSLKGEPLLISQLVRIACLNLTVQVVWEGLVAHQWSDAQLREWQARFCQFDLIGDFQSALCAERAFHDRIIDWVRKNRDWNRFDELGDIPGETESWKAAAGPVFRICPRGWFELEKVNYNRTFEELILTGSDPQTRRIDPIVCAANQEQLEKSIESLHGLILKHRVFTRILIPALTKAQQKFGLAQTTVDQAAVACALERYRLAEGHYPDALDSLVPRFMASLPRDVITGESLKYRRNGDGHFLLYSVGWNEKDDDGMIVPVKESRSEVQDITQGDWVWSASVKK